MTPAFYLQPPLAAPPPDEITSRRRWLVGNGCFIAFLALILVGVAPLQELAITERVGQGDIANQILHLSIFAILVLNTGTKLTARQLQPVPVTILLVLAYCLVSVSWAIEPIISLRRLVLTGLVIWVLFRFVADLGYDRTLLILRIVMIALLVLNYASVFLTPYGVHPPLREESSVVGNWRGVMPHKNIAGAACAFLVILEMFDVRRFPRLISWVAIAAALVFLNYTVSKTSIGLVGFCLIGGWLVRPYSANYRSILAVVALIAAGFALQLASAYQPELANSVTDPASFTGRGAIWPILIDYASEHLWTGAGFGSFWQIGNASPIWSITRSWVAQWSHGHNGYLDLLVTIGLPGTVLAVAMLVVWPLMRLFLSLSISKQQRALLFAMLAFGIGHNLTESSILNGPSVVEVFLILAIALIYRLAELGRYAALLRREGPHPAVWR